MAAGIWKRNGRYRAVVYVARDKRRVTRTFDTLTDARAWRAEAKALVNRGALRAPQAVTLDEAAVAWLAGAEDGAVRTRSGQPYKPATLRGYRQALDDHVLPVFGPAKLSAITTTDLQHLVDNWQGVGLAEATIRNAVKPLQAIYRRAASRGGLPVNPTRDLELPAPRPRKAEVVEHDTAAALLAAVPDTDRAVWGTALYAGLRYGELRALRWGAVDLATGTVRVEASWDPKAGRRHRRRTPRGARCRCPGCCATCYWITGYARATTPRRWCSAATACRLTPPAFTGAPTPPGRPPGLRGACACTSAATPSLAT
jgi:integrase